MKFLISNIDLEPKAEAAGHLKLAPYGALNLMIDDPSIIKRVNSEFFINQGYIRNYASREDMITSEKSSIEKVSSHWPASNDITGSFSSTIWRQDGSEIIICNDAIGIYPLYYLKNGADFYVSNSITWLGIISQSEIDETGILQHCSLPEYSNIGSRTILENCNRLLPGEWIKFDGKGNKLEVKYDNSLFNLELNNNPKVLVRDFWKIFQDELNLILKEESKINIALSGGMDSRILLGALPRKKIQCLSYGPKDSYEVKLTKRLAKLKEAKHLSFSDSLMNFPPKRIFEKYLSQTEALYLCSWLEILENISLDGTEILLLGDLSTALSGRSIKKFSAKKYQMKNFIRHSVLKREYMLEEFTEEKFEAWKDITVKSYTSFYTEKNIKALRLKTPRSKLIDEVKRDLEELFKRIAEHNLKYLEQAEELFTWYTHTRLPMGKQILLNDAKFKSYCPGLSISILRFTSSIHPNERLNQRFIKKAMRRIPELKRLGKVPTNQIPLVSQNISDLIRFPVWAIRSKIDGWLIKRMVRNKNPEGRYRLFKANNWVDAYQNPGLEKILNEYFEGDHLGTEYVRQVKEKAIGRKEMKRWPFANMDIISAAALNMQIHQIKNGIL